MLQLTRMQNEYIIIGDDIKITVLNDPQRPCQARD